MMTMYTESSFAKCTVKINQIHKRIITLEVKVKFNTDCEKSMQHYFHMWKMYDEANSRWKHRNRQ
jgi:hypothetical protein